LNPELFANTDDPAELKARLAELVRVGRTDFPPVRTRVLSFAFDVRPELILKSAKPAEPGRLIKPPPPEPTTMTSADAPSDPAAVITAPKLTRAKPPEHLPARERLLAMLQPPVYQTLHDRDIHVPFEPFAYQFEGIQFLTGSWSAILADEMGLGKTMQTILSIRLLIRSGLVRSVMLVCPKPLVTNWIREFHTWADELPLSIIEGSTWKRRTHWLHDRSPVKLCNYECLTRDAELLTENAVSFDLVVLDEAQRIKNLESVTAKVAHSIRRSRSWALTGTPVENRARDLVSLLEFVHQKPCDADRPDVLRDQVGAVLLRRTKEMVMSDMPPRLIRDTWIDLGPSQRDRYDAAEKDGVFKLNDLGDELTIEHVFELVRRLKQICNYDPVTGESAKLEYLRSTMEEVLASGKKAILFSQWVGTIEWLAERLPEANPLLYHGGIAQKDRDPILKEFKESPDRPLLMMSYGTGAVGLNLQFSNYVFLYDRWWNPAIEDQAINRAHRIGQKEPVFVFRFISTDTIEQRIAEVLQKKRELFEFLIGDQDAPDLGLNREDILSLFQLRVRKAA
jgi:SNF2 family DNA or RNA helicase